jgi:pilus assembly protein CpaE
MKDDTEMERTYPVRLLLHKREALDKFTALSGELGRFDAGGEGFPGPLGLVVYEIGDVRKDLARIRRALETRRVGEFMIVSESKDPEVVIAAMRAGAKEFIAWPASDEELREAMERFLERMDRATTPGPERKDGLPGHVVHVIGAKGGVGATTVAVNLTVECAAVRKDGALALVDMRMPFGEAPMFLDMECEYSWSEIAKDVSRVDDAFVSGLMTRHYSGVDVLPAPDRIEDVEISGPDAAKTMLSMLRSMYDMVVVDGSPYLDETAVKAIESSDEILLVVQLSLPCLANAKKFIDTFREADPATAEKINVVINRHLSKSEITVPEAEEILGRKVYARIENDYAGTLAAINQGKSIREAAPKSAALKGIRELAEKTAGGSGRAHAGKTGLLGRFLGRKTKPVERRREERVPGRVVHGGA